MGNWALVTGGSSGIGYAVADNLASRGYSLMLVSRTPAKLDAARERLAASHPGVEVASVAMDLACQGAAEQLFNLAGERGIIPEILVNDAGMFLYEEVTDTDVKKISDIILLHNLTVTLLCRLFGEAMAQKGGGRILNLSSYSVYMPYPGLALYSSTKAYIKAFSKAFRKEMRPRGVTVTTAAPAGVDTDLMGLPEGIRSLARKTGFLMKPSTAARRLVRATLRGRRYKVPGFYNYFYVPLLPLFSPISAFLLKRKKSAAKK